MNVLLIHQYARHPSSWGGTRFYCLCRALVEYGHDVTVIASRYEFKKGEAHRDVPEEMIDGVRYFWLDAGKEGYGLLNRGAGMIGFTLAAMRKATSLSSQFDVVVSSSPHLLQTLGAERFAARKGLPFVLEIRDIWPMSLSDVLGVSKWHPVWQALRLIEKHLYRRASWIVTLLPGSQDWIAGSGGDRSAIEFVPNGVDASSVSQSYPHRDGETFKIIYAGSHGAMNRLDTVIRAAKIAESHPRGDRIRVELIGYGPHKDQLQELAREIEARTVTFLDAVPRAEAIDKIGNADAAVIHMVDAPAFKYGISPNKLFDYMLTERPIIFGVRSSYDPVALSDCGISVPPEDPHAMAEAMIELASMSVEERKSMGERGREFVMKEHEWRVLGPRFVNVLDKAVARFRKDGA
ncbi:MAG: glycosyltransferase family 4 protein [Roseovarius sp.]